MYGSTDIARSIRRYLTLMWDKESDWTTRTARRVIADDDRPIAVVLLGDRRTVSARTSRNQGNIVEAVPVTIYAYPEVGKDEMEATVAADIIRDELADLISFGLSPEAPEPEPPEEEEPEEEPESEEEPAPPPLPPAWVAKSGPFRIPLWDYAGVPLTGAERAGPEDPHDVIWVDPDSLSVQNLEDPQDGKRRTVVIEFRASIERPGRIEPEGPPVASMPGQFKPVGSGEL